MGFRSTATARGKLLSPLSLDTHKPQDSSSWLPTIHRCLLFSAPQPHSILNASKIPQHHSIPPTPAQAGTATHPRPAAVLVAAHKAALGASPCPALSCPWCLGVAKRSVSLAGTWGAIVAVPLARLVSAAPLPGGPAGRGGQRTGPAGTKQQVAPAEVIRITFNARAGSIFSPVYAEGPGAALLMLQGARGTH